MGKTCSNGRSARSLISLLVASASAIALQANASAQAQTAQAVATRTYDIPSQPLSSALTEFARQSNVRILYAHNDLAGRMAPTLRGSYRAEDALRILLAETGLTARIADDGSIRLENPNRPQPGGAHNDEGDGRAVVDGLENAEAEVITVTGTRIRGAVPAGSNVLTLDRAAIDATGASTVQGAISTLPQNFPGVQNELSQLGSNAQKNISFGSAIDLRGLGSDATLTLLNGRRIAPAGSGNFVDVSIVPLAAVARIEVLADGASATYGSDAVGGVVNIILNTDFEGAQTQFRIGGDSTGDVAELTASHLYGAAWRTGNFAVGYEYRERSHLDADARDFTRSADLRGWGGSDFTRTSANPGNITRVGSTSVVFAIPEGQDGTSLSQSELIAGQVNRQEPNQSSYLLPEQTSHGFFFAGSQQLSDRIEVFADVLASRREAYAERAQVTTTLSVPQTNYYRQLNNLFPGQGNISIAYFLGDDLGPTRYSTRTDALSSVLGIGYDADNGWRTELSIAYTALQDHLSVENNFNPTGPLAAALASNNPATAFNPFADGSNTPRVVLDGLVFTQTTDNDSEIASWSAKADGPLFDMWGGAARVAVGAEQRTERFEIERFNLYPAGTEQSPVQNPGERTTNAYFAELFAPIVSANNNVPLVHSFSLSASVRHEQAEDVETSTTPRVGLNWALSPDFSLRGSWGHSFKAPQFQQTLSGIGGTLTTATAAQDPFADNGSTGVFILLGANPDLRPERAETWTAGFDLTPRWLSPFRLQATYFNIDFQDRITTPGSVSAALRNSTGLESVFFREPSAALIAEYLAIPDSTAGSVGAEGIEVIFDGRLTNLAALEVNGVDLSMDYRVKSALGELRFFASASGLLEYRRQATPAATFTEPLDTLFNPIDWRARIGASLASQRWNATFTGNYTDAYTDNLSIPNRRIDSLVTWDAMLSYDFADETSGPRLALSVQNLFDDEPPFANNSFGYGFDTSNFSPLGRFVAFEVRQRW